jgi:hypothetical protein
MAGSSRTNMRVDRSESRKKWATPELRKVDIEQITANNPTQVLNDGKANMS